MSEYKGMTYGEVIDIAKEQDKELFYYKADSLSIEQLAVNPNTEKGSYSRTREGRTRDRFFNYWMAYGYHQILKVDSDS